MRRSSPGQIRSGSCFFRGLVQTNGEKSGGAHFLVAILQSSRYSGQMKSLVIEGPEHAIEFNRVGYPCDALWERGWAVRLWRRFNFGPLGKVFILEWSREGF
jgi:hypothetical protein